MSVRVLLVGMMSVREPRGERVDWVTNRVEQKKGRAGALCVCPHCRCWMRSTACGAPCALCVCFRSKCWMRSMAYGAPYALSVCPRCRCWMRSTAYGARSALSVGPRCRCWMRSKAYGAPSLLLCLPTSQVLDEEFDMVHQAFATDSRDQSPWMYYRYHLR